MPIFKVVGKTAENRVVREAIRADSRNDAYIRMKKEGVFCYQLEEAREEDHEVYKLKGMQLVDFSRQLSGMISSGVPVMKAVKIIEQREDKKKVREVYSALCKIINRGNTLAQSMQETGSFPALMINMFKSGEENGQLSEAAVRTANYYEGQHKLNRKISTAMTYPKILAGVTLLVILVVFTLVLPQLGDTFANVDLPWITQLFMRISETLVSSGLYILIALAGVAALTVYGFSLPGAKYWLHKKKISLPYLGKLMRTIYTARFARGLSVLYISGIPMPEAVTVSAKTVGNLYIENQLYLTVKKIKEGYALSEALKEVDGFDKKLLSTVFVGEESGKLNQMLLNMADNFDYEAETASSKMVTLIEPAMILVMAVIIGAAVLSVLVPLMQASTTIG